MRFALEVFYCGTACLLAGALWRTGVPILVTMLVALVLVAHPASFQLPNRCGAEILLAPLMMGSIAATLLWWNLRDRKYSWQYAVHAAVWWALAWNVRKESIVLMPVFLVLFASVILADRKLGWPTAMRRAVVAVCLILFTCSAMEMAIKVVNWSRWGLYATTVQTAPGFKKAIKSLQRIRPNPPIDYVPVPVEVRMRAYAVSPTFTKLKPFLEGDVTRNWAVHSRPFTDSKGLIGLGENEVSAGWFYWAFYDAVVAAGYGTHPGEADRFLAQIGNEINSAIKDGRLDGRWVPLAIVDPAWSQWIPRLPQSLQRVGSTFFKQAVPGRPFDYESEKICADVFDKYTNRRSHLISLYNVRAEIEGWAVSKGKLAQTVEVQSQDGSLLGSASLDIPRPDVDKDRSTGFRLSLVVPSESVWKQAQLLVKLEDGTVIQQSLSNIPTAQVVNIPNGSKVLHIAIDRIESPKFSCLWKAQSWWETRFLKIQLWLLWPGIFAGLVVMVLIIVRPHPVDMVIIMLAVAVSARWIFFAILDASAWPGDQPRYLFAVYPLFSLLLVLLFSRLLTLPKLRKKDF